MSGYGDNFESMGIIDEKPLNKTPRCAHCGKPIVGKEPVKGLGSEVFHLECTQPPITPAPMPYYFTPVYPSYPYYPYYPYYTSVNPISNSTNRW